MKSDGIISSSDTKLLGENNIFTPLQTWMPSNMFDPLPYLDIGPLEELVEQNSQNGQIFVSDLNIDNILNDVEEENKKWNISSLTRSQIKDITMPKGIKNLYSYRVLVPFSNIKELITFDEFFLGSFFISRTTRC